VRLKIRRCSKLSLKAALDMAGDCAGVDAQVRARQTAKLPSGPAASTGAQSVEREAFGTEVRIATAYELPSVFS